MKSFFLILAAHKLEQEQKLNKAQGGEAREETVVHIRWLFLQELNVCLAKAFFMGHALKIVQDNECIRVSLPFTKIVLNSPLPPKNGNSNLAIFSKL